MSTQEATLPKQNSPVEADDLDIFFLAAKKLTYGFGLGLDGAGWCFLNKYITILTMFEGEKNEIDGLFE